MRTSKTYLCTFIILFTFFFACNSDDDRGGDNNPPVLSNEKQITDFQFNASNNSGLTENVIGEINQENQSVILVVPFGTDVTSLLPTIQVSAGATYSPTGAQDFTQPVTYTVTAENETTNNYNVTVNVAPSSDASIINFSFLTENNEQLNADVIANIDQGTQIISVDLPEGTEVTDLIPTIEISEGATIDPNGTQDFSTTVTYTVTSQSGNISTSYNVFVTVELDEEEEVELGEKNILMFVSHEDTYHSEYIIMRRALETSGYTVDVRSSNSQPAEIYTQSSISGNNDQSATYTDFQEQFLDAFGSAWQSDWNTVPDYVNVNGSIQDVENMMSYDALVVVGGTGAQAYRVDGSYQSQGEGDRLVTSEEIQAAAEKLNDLAIEALMTGKPVMAQCHGASLAPYWRVPGTTGVDGLGTSILEGDYATGFPEAATGTTLASLNVEYRGMDADRVTVSSPHSSLGDGGAGNGKIITTRDWYSHTVAHAARTLLNIIDTYPTAAELSSNISVLIIHGGAVNTSDCGVSNQTTNDVPCNYGTDPGSLPADYTDLVNLYQGNSANDNYNITIDDLDILGGATLPYDGSSITSIENYLSNYDVVVFYKHWASNITSNLQNAIVNYADDGGGVLSIHHGLYNSGKSILVNDLFEAESSSSGWSANLTEYNLVMTNYGHFVSTYGVVLSNPVETPSNWSSLPEGAANMSYSYYPNIEIEDEIYNNMTYTSSASFGRGVNEITPLFSDNVSSSQYHHASGYVKLFDGSNDGSVGKVAFFEPGERPENYEIDSPYGQILRNAVVWLGID